MLSAKPHRAPVQLLLLSWHDLLGGGGAGLEESHQCRGMFAGHSSLTDKRCRRNARHAGHLLALPRTPVLFEGGRIRCWCHHTTQP